MASGFDWDEANRAHIARHGVSITEAEEACSGFMLNLDSYTVQDELRYEDVGATSTGRILKLVTTDRRGLIRVVTAYDATSGTRRLYLNFKGKRYE